MIKYITMNSRVFRHLLFWLSWIIGFSFVKSLGTSSDEFLGWLVYYFATLPIFLAHTYIVVYWGGKLMVKGYRLIFFILLFIFCMYLFSVLELLVSHELLARWFPEIFEANNNYLAGANILISGIGNLYIVLVFIAVKIIRTWYISSEEQKNISQRKLEDRIAVLNSRIQPDLLMYATGRLEKMAENNSDNIPGGIAILAEILNGVMLTRDRSLCSLEEEMKLLRELLKLHAIINESEPIHIEIIGQESFKGMVPVLALFSAIEIVLRKLQNIQKISIDIANERDHFQVRIISEVFVNSTYPTDLSIVEEFDQLFPESFNLSGRLDEHRYILEMEAKHRLYL